MKPPANSMMQFPVVCPRCTTELLRQAPLADILGALAQGREIMLRTDCCSAGWEASADERNQIGQYAQCFF